MPRRSPACAAGVDLGDYVTRPCQARAIDAPAELWPRVPPVRYRAAIPTSWVELAIAEGKNRQVRRMTAAVGFPTLRLVRVAIGKLESCDARPGTRRVVRVAATRPLGRIAARRPAPTSLEIGRIDLTLRPNPLSRYAFFRARGGHGSSPNVPARTKTVPMDNSIGISSTACASRALWITDAAKSYPALAFGTAAVPFPLDRTSTGALADASSNLFDAAVNRKVDGAFTDLTH